MQLRRRRTSEVPGRQRRACTVHVGERDARDWHGRQRRTQARRLGRDFDVRRYGRGLRHHQASVDTAQRDARDRYVGHKRVAWQRSLGRDRGDEDSNIGVRHLRATDLHAVDAVAAWRMVGALESAHHSAAQHTTTEEHGTYRRTVGLHGANLEAGAVARAVSHRHAACALRRYATVHADTSKCRRDRAAVHTNVRRRVLCEQQREVVSLVSHRAQHSVTTY